MLMPMVFSAVLSVCSSLIFLVADPNQTLMNLQKTNHVFVDWEEDVQGRHQEKQETNIKLNQSYVAGNPDRNPDTQLLPYGKPHLFWWSALKKLILQRTDENIPVSLDLHQFAM